MGFIKDRRKGNVKKQRKGTIERGQQQPSMEEIEKIRKIKSIIASKGYLANSY